MRTSWGVFCIITAIGSFGLATLGLVELLAGIAGPNAAYFVVLMLGQGTFATLGARHVFKAADETTALPSGDAESTVLALATREGVAESAVKAPASLPLARGGGGAQTRD